jgi:hypothetical protein
MKKVVLALAAILYPATCLAMPTAQFVSRWKAVSKNPAHLSPDAYARQPEVKALTAELGKAFDAYKDSVLKARTDHVPPVSCPPKDLDLPIDQVIASAAGLPAQWQSREFTDSFQEIMKERYPCPAAS